MLPLQLAFSLQCRGQQTGDEPMDILTADFLALIAVTVIGIYYWA